MGRNTQGVRIMRLNDTDSIAAVSKVVKDDDDENGVDNGEEPINPITDSPTDESQMNLEL
jgi:DNA gyrase subunit A